MSPYLPNFPKHFVITDNRVSRLHMEHYSMAFGNATVVSLRAGERSKTLGSARRLYQRMLKRGSTW